MARRATKIREARSTSQNVLVVDAGNALFNTDGREGEPAEDTRGQTSVDALNRLGYDAVGLGQKDLLLGAADLKSRIAEAKGFTFVSANLVDKSTGKLLVKPYVIKTVGSWRVALVGITGGESTADFTVDPALGALTKVVAQLKGKADAVVVLSTAGLEANRGLAKQVQGITVLVSGGTGGPLYKPETSETGTVIVHAEAPVSGEAGRVLGRLDLGLDAKGAVTQSKGTLTYLDKNTADDPDMATWVAMVKN